MTSTYVHDPNAVLPYAWDWTAWLVDGDTIATHTILPPAEVDFTNDTHTDTAVTARLSAPTATIGAMLTVTCRITTAAGLTDDRSIRLAIRNR